MDKLYYTVTVVYTVDYYSEITRKELIIEAKTWINHKIIMLNEKSQTKKEYSLYDSIYKRSLKNGN